LLTSIEASYRGWVAVQLARPEGEAEALRIWRRFRALDAVGRPGQATPTSGTILTFVELPDGLVGWLTRGDQVRTRRLNVSLDALAAIVTRFRRGCSDPGVSRLVLQSGALQIYSWVVEPFADQLIGEDRNLTLDLDGALAGIPVQALMAGNARYFGDRFSLLLSSSYGPAPRSISTVGSAKVLVVADPSVSGESAARFPPLPDSIREATVIRAAFPGSTVLEGRAATIDALSASLPGADVVHFSGHGYANADNGALLFAPKDARNADYDLLRSSDLSRQDWSHCRLAVLSACAAAAGETHGVHNPDSLVRALTRAGVTCVLANLWSVDSAATLELMRAFYAALSSGASPAEALRAGQQSVRRRPEWDHPYYWAGFQLYGTT
jgi:CHAT domain-containing protein